ncbi:ANL family adenylate-forming protein [Saccharothrix isguenensis]
MVCNSDSGAQLAVGEIVEVRVRSPQMMDSYNGSPALTAQVLQDGWYRTGDIGFLDERGYLTLLGRVADVIKVDGVKVHPIVVEAEILSHPGVRHAAVYGVRDEDGSEHIHAAIECDSDAVVEVGDIRARIAEVLSPIHVSEKINVLNALPMNGNGKSDKMLLRSKSFILVQTFCSTCDRNPEGTSARAGRNGLDVRCARRAHGDRKPLTHPRRPGSARGCAVFGVHGHL